MALVINQPSLSAGEITPSLFGRADIDAYRLGLARASNFFVNYHGGLKNRSGFRFIGQAKRNDEVVLIPFSFSTIQTYMLEFGENYIRFISNGGYLVDGGNNIIEVSTPYLASELSRLTFTQSADILTLFHKNHPIQELRRNSATDWELVEFQNSGGPFETINIDQDKTIYASVQSGTVDLVANFDAFNDNVVGKLLFLDQQTSGEVRHWIQRMNVEVDDLVYYAGNYYRCVEAPFLNNKQAQTGDTPPTHLEGDIWDGPGEDLPDDERDAAIGVLWRYVHSGFGIVRIDSYSDSMNAVGTVINTLPETVVGGTTPGIDWSFPNETTNKDYLLDTPSAPSSDFASDFEVTITNDDDSSEITLSYPAQWTINFATDTVTLSQSPTAYFTPAPTSASVLIQQKESIRETYKWAFEPWREDSKYPQCGTYYQQRLTVAASLFLPQTIWMSRVDSFVDFSKNRPLLADDTMRFDVNSLQVNEIFHMLPLNALLAFTAGGVWSINQGSNDVITPENPPSVRIQSYDGSSPLRPIVTGSTGLYVQDGGQIVRDIGFDFSNDAFIGIDLTVRAQHLFEGRTIVSWCYAKNPYKTIWVAFNDGKFAVFTYLKEQQIWGWCPGETLGSVISFASVREGSQDAVYAVVKRDGINFVERLSDRFFSDPNDQFFVDSGLTYDGRNKTDTTITLTSSGDYEYPDEATMVSSAAYFTAEMVGQSIIFFTEGQKTPVKIKVFNSDTNVTGEIQRVVPDEIKNTPVTNWGLGANEFSGLDHLEGKTVSVMADAGDEGDFVVTNGQVEIDFDAVVVHIGLPYCSIIQTLDIELSPQGETARPNKKNINKVFTVTRSTTGIQAGTSLDNLNPYKAREDENYGEAPTRRSEILEIDVEGQWERPGRVYLVQDRPIETEILSIMPEVQISEYN